MARLIFDVETTALPNAEELIPEPKVDSRIKDEEKRQAARDEKMAEKLELAALDPDLASVRLISMLVWPDGLPELLLIGPERTNGALVKLKAKVEKVITDKEAYKRAYPNGYNLRCGSERDALIKFWGNLIMCDGRSVGYNNLAFDIPFLMRRSMDLGLQPGITPSLAKYRTEPTTDMFGVLFNWAWSDTKKLKWLAKRYNLGLLVEETQDGGKVEDMEDHELVAYGLSDLAITTGLYRLMDGVYFTHSTEKSVR